MECCLCMRLCCATRRPSDSGQPDPQDWNAPQHIVQELSNEALLFLLASRYCEVDGELKEVAGTASAVDLQLRLPAYPLRLHTGAGQSDGAGGLSRTHGRLPRLLASGHYALPLYDHSGPLLHRLSRRYRRPTVI